MNDRTVGRLWVAYSRRGFRRLGPYIRDGYVKVWRRRIEPHLTDTPVAALPVGVVEDWLARTPRSS